MLFRLPDAADVIDNPEPEQLKDIAARMPNAQRTEFGSVNVQTEVVSRSKRSTFIVTDEPDGQNQAITREEGERWARAQDAYIAGMQQQLYFTPAEGEDLEPELTVIYTPNLKAAGYPDDRLIAVDLEQG